MIPVLISSILRRELGYHEIKKRKREKLEKQLDKVEETSKLKKKERKKIKNLIKVVFKKKL